MDNPATTPDVSSLTQSIARGDRSAFATFYDAWFDRLFRYAQSSTGRDESFCLDVVQDAMLKIMRSMKRFDEAAALDAWLYVVVMRCALDRIRAERRRTAREVQHAQLHGASSESRETGTERVRWLERQLAGLDPSRSLLVALRYRVGATLDHIGRVVGLGPGAVDGRLSRSLAQLRAAAQEEFDEP